MKNIEVLFKSFAMTVMAVGLNAFSSSHVIAKELLSAGKVEHIDPANPKLQYVGRWNRNDPSKPAAFWQGSSIILKFNGTKIAGLVKTKNPTAFKVIVDGMDSQDFVTDPSEDDYLLASRLEKKTHTIEMMMNRKSIRGVVFCGFRINGCILPPPVRPPLRIEFFGDSNTSGTSLFSEKDRGVEGTYYAYPAILCRMLGAEMNNQAVGGAKLKDVVHQIYSESRRSLDRTYRSGFAPHIIVVNAGANNLPVYGESLKKDYREIIDHLRKVYGPAPHVVFYNAYGWDLREPANYTRDFVKEFKDPNVSVCLFPWLWEQWHGCMTDHSGQAHVLADHLRSINRNWVPVKLADIFDGFGRKGDLANGSFENSSPFGGFGWRYFKDGVKRIRDPVNAPDGQYYIRLKSGQKVHQPADATGDFEPGGTIGDVTYAISAQIRGVGSDAAGEIAADFQGQKYRTRGSAKSKTFKVGSEWKEYRTTAMAPKGTWTIYITLKSVSGTVEFDDVKMITDLRR